MIEYILNMSKTCFGDVTCLLSSQCKIVQNCTLTLVLRWIYLLFLPHKEHGSLCRNVWRWIHRRWMFSSVPRRHHTQCTKHGKKEGQSYRSGRTASVWGLIFIMLFTSSCTQVIMMQLKLFSAWLRNHYQSSSRSAGPKMMWWGSRMSPCAFLNKIKNFFFFFLEINQCFCILFKGF